MRVPKTPKPLAPPPELHAEVDRIRHTARRRYITYLAVALPLAGVIGFAVYRLQGNDSDSPPRTHHRSSVGLLVAAVLLIALAIGYFFLIRWLLRRHRGSWVPLTWGVPHRQRREITGSVRDGHPSSDPLTRYLGARIAVKISAQRQQTLWGTPLLCAFFVIVAIPQWDSSRPLAILSLALVVFLLAMLPRTLKTVRGADTYLRSLKLDDQTKPPRAASDSAPGPSGQERTVDKCLD